jgi:hypothetical protein
MCIKTYPNHESRGAKVWVLLDRMIQAVRSDAFRVRLRQLHPTFHQQCGSRDFRLYNQHGSSEHSRMWPGIAKGGGVAWRSSWLVTIMVSGVAAVWFWGESQSQHTKKVSLCRIIWREQLGSPPAPAACCMMPPASLPFRG